ncbi:MAG: hypothetical protein FWD69_16215 [Polyangiaceae bacterium]|nr:hypothetical protein [Polyangiaceae bacterium]
MDETKLEATLRCAFEIARSGRPGPVVVDIPKNVQNANVFFDGACTLPIPGYRARLHAIKNSILNEADCAAFFDALSRAERPLLYVGGGVIAAEASAALRQFANTFGIPVTTTLMGLGAVDTTQPLSLHMLGMHGTAYANYAVEDCDFLFAVGSRFDERVASVPGRFARGAKFVAHLDIDPAEINKVRRVHWHHLASAVRQKFGWIRRTSARCAASQRPNGTIPSWGLRPPSPKPLPRLLLVPPFPGKSNKTSAGRH